MIILTTLKNILYNIGGSMFFLMKRADEVLQNVGIDFTDRLLTGETVSSGTATCATSGIVTSAGNNTTQVYCDLSAGVDGTEYTIEYKATGSLGSVLEAVVLLCISDN